MIQYRTGNILDSNAEALVNTVNTVGVMGKGIALQFRKAYPNNYKIYKKSCGNNELEIGKLLVTKDSNISSGEKIIINFPTKKHWRSPSEYLYIEQGLDSLIQIIKEYNISSIAIPPLGSGNGGLDWRKVKTLIEQKLSEVNITIYLYEPNSLIKEKLKKERVKLTPARALLLYVLYDLISEGEYVSEFSSEKVCYFLQSFGAKKYVKLEFEPHFYGPYSGKVRFLLNALNGSYVMGYSGMNKKPFQPLTLVADGHNDVVDYVNKNVELKKIAETTTTFLTGFYSDFALELLSSVDYITKNQGSFDKSEVSKNLENWSDRKRTMFSSDKYLDISLTHLKTHQFA